MSDCKITQDMFNALDYEKKGLVSKQHLIDQMSDYFIENNLGEEAISKISLLEKYPDIIVYEDFKQIYRDLTESKNSNFDEDDEDEEILICSVYEEIIQGNGSDSDISENELWSRSDFYGSKNAVKGSIIDMTKPLDYSIVSFNKHKEIKKSDYQNKIGSLHRRAINKNKSTSISSTGYSLTIADESKDEFDELSYFTDSGMSMAAEEVDRLAENYKSVVVELSDMKYKLEDSTKKYVNQREMANLHNDRILVLEDQIRQLETVQHEQMEFKRKERTISKNDNQQRNEVKMEEQIIHDGLFRQEVLTRLNTLESEYNASNAEYERMNQECNILIKEKESLEKSLKSSKKRCYDLELTLQNLKSTVSLQMMELQNERDTVEKINKELYDKLQDARLSYRCTDSHSIRTSPALDRPLSWTGQFSFTGSASSSSKHSFELGSGLSSSPSCTTISQLERVVHCLTMDNRNLVEKVSHLETLEFYQRQRLNISNNMNFANEIEQLSVSDLKKSLSSEREVAKRLQLYMMGLTNRLMMAGYIEAFRQG